MSTTKLSTLATQALEGFKRTKKGRGDWLVGTFQMAAAFSAARKELPSDQAFHDWIKKAGLATVSKDDRPALICIGENRKAARHYFRNSDSLSWRMCASAIKVLVVPVSQPAKPSYEMRHVRIIEKTTSPRHLNLIVNAPQQSRFNEIGEHRFGDAIKVVRKAIDTSSLPTATVAHHWLASSDGQLEQVRDRDIPQIRKAANWLVALAKKLDENVNDALA